MIDRILHSKDNSTMRVLLVLLMITVLSLCCSGKKMWGARSKRESAKDDKKESRVDKSKTRIKSKIPRVQGEHGRESIFDDMDLLASQMDDMLGQLKSFLSSGKFEETLKTEVAQEWLDNLRSIDDHHVSQFLGDMNFDDPHQLTEQLLLSVEQLQSQKSELLQLISQPAFLESLLNEIPPEYQSLIQPFLSGNFDKFKEEFLSLRDLDNDMKKLIVDIMDGNFRPKEAIKSSLTDEQIEVIRQQLVANPEMNQIPSEVLKNPLLFSQFVKTSMQDMFAEEFDQKSNGRSKSRAV